MKQVISTERIPIKLWLDDIEKGALKQAKNVANLPFAYKHFAVMPDSHQGYGMPIGGVLATEGVIIPNAVGVDIGCGMGAMRTDNNNDISDYRLKKVMGMIREQIPVGFNHRKESLNGIYLDNWASYEDIDRPIVDSTGYNTILKQMGTLGGGNHFIEIQRDQFGYWWIMVHSGSRNIGKRVADHYNKTAKKLNERWYSSVLSGCDLAFLPIETQEAKYYGIEMTWCVEFAKYNRKVMLDIINDIFDHECHFSFYEQYDVAHNYARFEHHFGKNVIVHRKGATAARLNEVVIIPGSQGTKSYFGYGLGNADSFNSCSHGAGRTMSRTKARNKLDLETEIDRMDKQGIIHGMRHQKDLDESAGAYKDIDQVMRNQNDLVNVKFELTPKAVIKG